MTLKDFNDIVKLLKKVENTEENIKQVLQASSVDLFHPFYELFDIFIKNVTGFDEDTLDAFLEDFWDVLFKYDFDEIEIYLNLYNKYFNEQT